MAGHTSFALTMQCRWQHLFLLIECIEGYMRGADSGNCAICPKGTYSDTIDASSCTSCPAGQTTAQEGRDNANECFGNKTTILWVLWGLDKYLNV